MSIYTCRAALQIYRSKATFLFDQLLHLGCGTFISIAIQVVGREVTRTTAKFEHPWTEFRLYRPPASTNLQYLTCTR